MSFGKGSAPSAPDPQAVATAQEGVNQATINQLAAINRVNTSNPVTGGTSWVQAPDGTWTQQTNYSPATLAQANQQIENENLGLGNLGNAEARLAGLPNPGGAVGPGAAIDPMTGQIQTGSDISTNGIVTNAGGGSGNIQTSIASATGDPAIAQATNSVYSQLTSRLDPQWAQAQRNLEDQLTAQGISQGDPAWNEAMNNFNLQKTDAYNTAANTAVQTGQAEQNTLFGQAATAGSFANTAQNQQFQQLMTQAGFTNTAQQQAFMEQVQKLGLNNAAVAQMLQQMITARAAPINEVNALQTGAQVSNPSGGISTNITPSGAPNMLGADQLGYQGALNQYNAGVGQSNNLYGSLLKLGTTPLSSGGGLGSSALGKGASALGSAATGIGKGGATDAALTDALMAIAS